MADLKDLAEELMTLNDEHFAQRVIDDSYVQWCLSELYDILSADVAPVVHGRWISWEEAGNFVPSPDRHECSICHDAAQVLVNGFELLSDYCPNCGAKMDEEETDQ